MRLGELHSVRFIATQNPDILDYTIDNRHIRKEFAFRGGISRFRDCCADYFANDMAPLWENADFERLAGIFDMFPNNSHIIIETDDYQYIPFEALRTEGRSGRYAYLGERCRISRKAAGDDFIGGNVKRKRIVCVLQCFEWENRKTFSERLKNILSQYPDVFTETQTVKTIEDLITCLRSSKYSVIHIIAHIEDAVLTGEAQDERIPLSSIKNALQTPGIVQCGVIALSCCGQLNFFRPGEENLFSPFIRQTEVKALVGMCRTIDAGSDLSYLDAFYHTLFSGKSAAEAVQCAIARNTGAPQPKEPDPLPMIHFGNPECAFNPPFVRDETVGRITRRAKLRLFISRIFTRYWKQAVMVTAAALIAVLALIQTRPRIEHMRIEGLSLAGRAVWIGAAGAGREFVAAAAARLDDDTVIYPKTRTAVLRSDGSFMITLFENADQIKRAAECYAFILAVTPADKVYLNGASDTEYARFVNEHSKTGNAAIIENLSDP